jgi:hypothetical protein
MQSSDKQPYEPPKLECLAQYSQLIGAGFSLPIGTTVFEVGEEIQ